MGINRTSIFLHTFVSSLGVSVGAVSGTNRSVVLFERCPECVVNGLSTPVAIEEGELKGTRGRGRRKNFLHGLVSNASRSPQAHPRFFFHPRVKSKVEGREPGRATAWIGPQCVTSDISLVIWVGKAELPDHQGVNSAREKRRSVRFA